MRISFERIKICLAFLFLGLVSWGSAYFFIKLALKEMSPWSITFYRYSIAAVILWSFIFLFRKDRYAPKWSWKHMVILGITNNAIPILCGTWAEKHISSSLTGLIVGSGPIFVAALSAIILKERLNKLGYIGLLLGFLGLTIMFVPNIHDTWSFVGLSAVLMSSLCLAMSSVYIKWKLESIDFLVCAATACTTASIFIGVTGYICDEHFMRLPQEEITRCSLIWLILFCSTVDYLVFVYLIQKIGATRVAMADYLAPISIIMLGTVFLGETLFWHTIIGVILMFIGVFLTNHAFILYTSRSLQKKLIKLKNHIIH